MHLSEFNKYKKQKERKRVTVDFLYLELARDPEIISK